MTASHFQTCYICAPLTIDTTPLRLALQERGIRSLDALTTKPKGSTLDTIESAIAPLLTRLTINSLQRHSLKFPEFYSHPLGNIQPNQFQRLSLLALKTSNSFPK